MLLEPAGAQSGSSASTSSGPPSATFSFGVANGEVTITHSGDAIDAARLTTEVDGEPVITRFSGAVVPGESVTLTDVPSGAAVIVTWDDGDEAVVLARFVTPWPSTDHASDRRQRRNRTTVSAREP